MLGVLGGKGLGRSKGKGEGKGSREVNMSGRHFDDSQMVRWCERLQVGSSLPMGITGLNLSNNELGDASATAMAQSLLEVQMPIRVLKLFSNRLGDAGAIALSKYIEESNYALAELHLSHNLIKREGAAALLTAGVGAKDRSGGPRYPSFDTVGQCKPVPLWLRLEFNLIEEGHLFQKEMEVKLLEVRRSRGFLPDDAAQLPMLCEAVEGYGCSSRGCSLLCPGGLGGTPGGPVVHAPHLRKQRHPDDVPGACRGMVARQPMLARPAPGDEPLPGALKPAAVLPRPRSPVRFNIGDDEEGKEHQAEKGEKVPLPVKQCRFADVRLTEGGLREQGTAPTLVAAPAAPAVAPAAVAREATPEPRPRTGLAPPDGTPPKQPLPKTGQTLRVARQVTADDAIKAGYAPENYLQPLKPGEEVIAAHVCEGEEAGWIWAQRSCGGQVEHPGGWLSLDAVTVPPAAAIGGS